MGEVWAFLVVMISFALAVALKFFFENHLSNQIKNYKNIFKKIVNALGALFVVTGVYLATVILNVEIKFILWVKVIIVFLGLYLLFLLTNYFTDTLVHAWYKGEIKAKVRLVLILNLVLKLLITLFVVFVLLKFWSIDLMQIAKEIIGLIRAYVVTWAIAIFIVYLIVAKFVLFIFKSYFREVVKKSKTKLDDILVMRIEGPLTWLIILVGVIVALNIADFGGKYIVPLIQSLITVVFVHTLIRLTDDLLEEWAQEEPEKIDEDIVQITSNFVKVVLIIVGLIILMLVWGFDIKSLLLSLGIVSVVLGLALKGTLDNVFSGLGLMLDHNFRVGDSIQLESGQFGEVNHIGLRSTKIRTYDNELLIVPNSVLANMRLINYAKPDNHIRLQLPFGVEYGSDIEKVKKVIKKALMDVKEISKPEKTEVWFVKMNDFSLDFLAIFYLGKHRGKHRIESNVNSLIWATLKKNKIGIPFPTRTVYMKKGKRKR